MSRWIVGLGISAMISASTGCLAEEGNAKAGESVFKRCKACHEINKERNKIGPSLVGIVDRKAGIAEKYKYSKSLLKMAEEGLVWNVENLDKYLMKPRDFIKRGKMTFAGLKNPEDRANLIAFLKSKSKAK